MTHRGSFQPVPFFDSVLQGSHLQLHRRGCNILFSVTIILMYILITYLPILYRSHVCHIQNDASILQPIST